MEKKGYPDIRVAPTARMFKQSFNRMFKQMFTQQARSTTYKLGDLVTIMKAFSKPSQGTWKQLNLREARQRAARSRPDRFRYSYIGQVGAFTVIIDDVDSLIMKMLLPQATTWHTVRIRFNGHEARLHRTKSARHRDPDVIRVTTSTGFPQNALSVIKAHIIKNRKRQEFIQADWDTFWAKGKRRADWDLFWRR